MDKGINRLEKSLDMIKLLTTLQEIQDIKNVTFDKHDSLLLKLQQKRVLSASDSESFSDKNNDLDVIYKEKRQDKQADAI